MALIFLEGFEQYPIGTTPVEMAEGGWKAPIGFTGNLSIVAGSRHGSFGHAYLTTFIGISVYRPVVDVTEFTFGFAFHVVATSGNMLVNLKDNGTSQVNIVVTAAGEIQVRRNTTELDITSGQNIQINTWYFLECKFKIDNAVGTYEVHLDGTQILVGTSEDTQNSANNTINQVWLESSTLQDNRFDDLYFLDVSGSDNTGILGDCRVETVFPDADGNEVDFTALSGANWTQVDDGLAQDKDSTYNHGATATDRDLYAFAALSGDVGTVFGVEAMMHCRKEEAGFREVKVIGRSGTSEAAGPVETLGTNYRFKKHVFENNIDGGADWTETTVNAAQFGLEIET